MKIAYNWLKNYLDIDLNPDKVAELLTDCGLEVEGVEQIETVKGGLKGLVIGQVMVVKPHPNADKLKCTLVNVGNENLLPIVCGASNVAVNQKVVVATVGTQIFPTEGEPFVIKKAKIRGEVSEGMICAEDEIGLGKSHDGILVLPNDATIGLAASNYFNITTDFVFEIGLTPNRADAMSHFGVARDLLAVLKHQKIVSESADLNFPEFNFSVDNNLRNISVTVNNTEACPRYCGITISDVTVAESPDWLKNKLRSIGLNPHNNVVDVTNFILHDMGQPLHAFDADKISSNQVVVQTLKEGTNFTTLDDTQRKLHGNDLMICNENEPMCIAGVFGGKNSGVTLQTKSVFLEAAYFNPVFVRKTAKRHKLNTDASFRFERGIDPNITMLALKRAAVLIKELGNGKISSDPTDTHPEVFEPFEVEVDVNRINQLIGKEIDFETIKSILNYLDIQIIQQEKNKLKLAVAPYRVDVRREADIVEEVLRIYGYNQVEIPNKINASVSYSSGLSFQTFSEQLTQNLVGLGFNEAMSNSLISAENELKTQRYNEDFLVYPENPLSAELNILRPDLLVNAIESVRYNLNRQQNDLKLFELGKGYLKNTEGYTENRYISIVVTGEIFNHSWVAKSLPVDFYYLKGIVDEIFSRLDVLNQSKFKIEELDSPSFSLGLSYFWRKQNLGFCGKLKPKTAAQFDVKAEVFFAQINLDALFQIVQNNKRTVEDLPKFPSVKRDLALLIDNKILFKMLQQAAFEAESNLLHQVNLFDVYEGKNLPEGKKSYGVSFVLMDKEKTLTDTKVEQIMGKILSIYKSRFGAELR